MSHRAYSNAMKMLGQVSKKVVTQADEDDAMWGEPPKPAKSRTLTVTIKSPSPSASPSPTEVLKPPSRPLIPQPPYVSHHPPPQTENAYRRRSRPKSAADHVPVLVLTPNRNPSSDTVPATTAAADMDVTPCYGPGDYVIVESPIVSDERLLGRITVSARVRDFAVKFPRPELERLGGRHDSEIEFGHVNPLRHLFRHSKLWRYELPVEDADLPETVRFEQRDDLLVKAYIEESTRALLSTDMSARFSVISHMNTNAPGTTFRPNIGPYGQTVDVPFLPPHLRQTIIYGICSELGIPVIILDTQTMVRSIINWWHDRLPPSSKFEVTDKGTPRLREACDT